MVDSCSLTFQRLPSLFFKEIEKHVWKQSKVSLLSSLRIAHCQGVSTTSREDTYVSVAKKFLLCLHQQGLTMWIDEDEGLKGECATLIQRRVRCFCEDSLTLRTSGTARNPNRRFMSCPNRRCKFFEWVDKDDKLGSIKIQGASRQSSSTLDGVNLGIRGTMEEHAILQAQEGNMNRLSVEIERFNVEIRQLDDCVERLCDEFNVVQEQIGRLEDNMKKQKNCS
ncbi:hypothetical protein PIB30_035142 [Stylosanthes scabra]|uniref:GRF-type domain-containing protein n=1 Tax=Stylosanthes scabra TaxID=79078 RepID=A0ABU6VCD4_9FABA|nr:hypothetical protein [Stylosanthes scabra]